MMAKIFFTKTGCQKKKLSSVTSGFTLIELLLVIAVIAIIVSLLLPSYKSFRSRAEKAVCLSQMRVIHTALDTYILDKSQWPQIPESIFYSNDENLYWKWWISTMEPYGTSEKIWLCPSDKLQKKAKKEYSGSYMPAKFDSHHFTPYRWSGSPWLIERGKLHKGGAHVMLLDGSIRGTEEVF